MWSRRTIAAVIALLGGVGVVVVVDPVRDLPEEQRGFTERVLCDSPSLAQCNHLMRRTVRDVPGDGGPRPAERTDCDSFDVGTLHVSERLWCLQARNENDGAITAWQASWNTMAPLADGGVPDPDGCWVHLQLTPRMVKILGDRLTVGASDSCLPCTSLDCLPARVKSADGTQIAHRFAGTSLFDPQPDGGPDAGL